MCLCELIVGVFVCTSVKRVYLCVCANVCTYTRVNVCINDCKGVHMLLRACSYGCAFEGVCVCVCVCTRMFAQVCVCVCEVYVYEGVFT